MMKKSAKKKTNRTAVTTVDWKVFKKSQPNINDGFYQNTTDGGHTEQTDKLESQFNFAPAPANSSTG